MKYPLYFIALIMVMINGCKEASRNSNPSNVQQDNCLWIKHDEKLLNDLFKSSYAKSISDSFRLCLYINNYKLKVKRPELDDSINLFQLRIVPYITTNQGDGIHELSFAFTDSSCSNIYDRLVRSNASFIYGIRFSVIGEYVQCYLSTDRPCVVDSGFMEINRKIKNPDFIKIIRQNEHKINDDFKARLRQLKVL